MSGMNLYQEVIYKSRYSRWIEEENRRETWDETIDRYISFFKKRNQGVRGIPWKDLRDAIYNLEVMPSMRALMTAGIALDRDEIANYNCSYIVIDSPRSFDEAMYILMAGAGCGFSVERQFINKLPEISEDFHDTDTIIVVKDSKIGWSTSFREMLSLLWSGQIPKWDISKVRPAGAKLKTFGGRASGPEPLIQLFEFCVQLFKSAAGRKLTSIECHDIMCMISEVVVSGGVRRSACISLSNLSDDRMRHAKSGQWWLDNPQRALANNSAVYTDFPDIGIFMQEWQALYDSKSGERGIINRMALERKVASTERRETGHEWGLNPCAEAILRPFGLCNLTEVVVRENDTEESLQEKIKLATILGTIQADMTNFRYLRKIWKKNAEEEALLGVSLTGIMDNSILSNKTNDCLPDILCRLKNYAISINKEFSKKIHINQAAQVTLTKPSGTISQLVNSSSGIHPRFSEYYNRGIRIDRKDPISKVLIDSNIPYEEDHMNQTNYVFSFPIKSPKGSIFIKDMDAIMQLEHWLIYAENWCEGNPSCTIYVKEDEWLRVGSWVYDNFDKIGGLSFLPLSNHNYKQQPYIEITEEEYIKLHEKMPKEISWNLLYKYESEDNTAGSQELACVGGACEL